MIACEEQLSILRAYQFTGRRRYLDALLAWYEFFRENCRQPNGATMMDEEWGWAGAKRGTETCDIAAESFYRINLLGATADGRIADDLERVQFNAAPACVSRDFRRHTYLQIANRVKRNDVAACSFTGDAGEEIGAYKTAQWPLCRAAALNRILPNFIQAMWMKTAEGGLAATLYGPCTFETDVRGGKVKLVEETDYPFSDAITIRVAAAPKTAFPISVRIPAWCEKPEVAVNGEGVERTAVRGFVELKRAWQAGDEIRLRFPMKPVVTTMRDMNDFGRRRAYVSYGPFLMVHAFPEKDENTVDGPVVEPALDLKSVVGAEVVSRPIPRPWNWPLDAPLRLKARSADGRPLELIPAGCAKLKISLFEY